MSPREKVGDSPGRYVPEQLVVDGRPELLVFASDIVSIGYGREVTFLPDLESFSETDGKRSLTYRATELEDIDLVVVLNTQTGIYDGALFEKYKAKGKEKERFIARILGHGSDPVSFFKNVATLALLRVAGKATEEKNEEP